MKKKSVVINNINDSLDAIRWRSFLAASAVAYEYLTEEWLSVFDAQADPQTASTELVRLIDIAIQHDMEKGK